MQRVTGRTSIRAWNPLLTFFLFGCNEHRFLWWFFVFVRKCLDWWFCKKLLKLWLVLYKITFFHSSFLYSRHWGLVLCHEWQYFFFLLAVVFRSLDSLLWFLLLIVDFLSKFVGSLRPWSVFFFLVKFELFSSKVVFKEFFRRILKASPLTNPFLTVGGWHEAKCVCKKVCLKCVFSSRIDFSLNLVPLYTMLSKNAVSVSNRFRPWI